MSSDPVPDVPLLAGMGGVNSSESQSVHFGRKAIILSRDKNTDELIFFSPNYGYRNRRCCNTERVKQIQRLTLVLGNYKQISEELRMAGKGIHGRRSIYS